MCYLIEGQKLVIEDRSENSYVKLVTKGNLETEKHLANNHTEGDTMVWLHAALCDSQAVVIYSPNNDVYHIGLAAANRYPAKKILFCYKLPPIPSHS